MSPEMLRRRYAPVLTTRFVLAAIVWSCSGCAQIASVDEKKTKVALELLDRVDEATSFKRGADIMNRRTVALKRLPGTECQGIVSARFRLETLEMSLLIKSELAASEARLLVSKKRLEGAIPDLSTPEDFVAGRAVGEVAELLAASWKARFEGQADPEYVSQVVNTERLRDDCATDNYIRAEHQNEIESNRHLIAALTSDTARLRALVKRVNIEPIIAAQAMFEKSKIAERAKNADATKSRARAEDMRKRLAPPDLQKSRQDLTTAIRRFVAAP